MPVKPVPEFRVGHLALRMRTQGSPQPFRHIPTARDRIRKQPDIDNPERSTTAEIKKGALARTPFCFAEAELTAPDGGVAERQDLQSEPCLYNNEIKREVGLPARVGAPFGALQGGTLDAMRKVLLLL